MGCDRQPFLVHGGETFLNAFKVFNGEHNVDIEHLHVSLNDKGQLVGLLEAKSRTFRSMHLQDTGLPLLAERVHRRPACGRADPCGQSGEACRKKLKQPPLTRERYVALLLSHGCTGMAQTLGELWSVGCPNVAKDGTLFYESDVPVKKTPRKNAARRAKS